MSEPEQFNPDEVYFAEGFRTDSGRMDDVHTEFHSAGPLPANGRQPMGRLFGSPLPMGGTRTASQDSAMHRPAPPGRSLSTTPAPAAEEDTSASRAMNLMKQAVPFVQKLLPLIDGNFGSALANLLSPRPHPSAGAPVDLSPVSNQISDLQMQHNDLRSTVQEQNTSLKRVEDRLEMVREATDRNTLEQQELIDDLKSMGKKVNVFAVTLSALLLLSLVLNVILYLHIRRDLP
jgi:hypothetical protein